MWLSLLALFRGKWVEWALALFIIGGILAVTYRSGYAARQPDIDKARAQTAQVRAEFEAAIAKWNAEAAEFTAKLTTAAAEITRLQADADRAEAAADRRRTADFERMRQRYEAQRADGSAIQPAAAAPAECRQFESDARLLPEGDARVLGDLAVEADRAVRERNTAVESYNALADRFLAEQLR